MQREQEKYSAFVNMTGAIFDMDGTLLDSMFIWDHMGENYLKSRGILPEPDVREVLRPLSLRQAAEHLICHYGLAEPAEQVMENVNRSIERFYCEEASLKPGAAEVLESWRRRGVRMCVATATDRCLAETALRRTGILPYFEEIFTCNEIGAGKDRPDIFLKALSFLGTDRAATWVFEDALFAAKSVKAAGIPLAVVRDDSTEGQRRELEEIADALIDDWREYIDY